MAQQYDNAKTGLWAALRRPSAKYTLGGLLTVGFVVGIIFWGGFNTAMEATNNEQFCVSCHEMRDNVYQEYKNTIHYANRTGVRATCPDCHVPKEWVYKVKRKWRVTSCSTTSPVPSTPRRSSMPSACNSPVAYGPR